MLPSDPQLHQPPQNNNNYITHNTQHKISKYLQKSNTIKMKWEISMIPLAGHVTGVWLVCSVGQQLKPLREGGAGRWTSTGAQVGLCYSVLFQPYCPGTAECQPPCPGFLSGVLNQSEHMNCLKGDECRDYWAVGAAFRGMGSCSGKVEGRRRKFSPGVWLFSETLLWKFRHFFLPSPMTPCCPLPLSAIFYHFVPLDDQPLVCVPAKFLDLYGYRIGFVVGQSVLGKCNIQTWKQEHLFSFTSTSTGPRVEPLPGTLPFSTEHFPASLTYQKYRNLNTKVKQRKP